MLRSALSVAALLHCATAGRAPATLPTQVDADASAQPQLANEAAERGADADQRRRLQTVSPGALDADICSASIPATITNEVGTLHDDQTDTVIDCSQVRAPTFHCSVGQRSISAPPKNSDAPPPPMPQGGCGGLDSGSNGYGDNLDWQVHIPPPPHSLTTGMFLELDCLRCSGKTLTAPAGWTIGQLTPQSPPPVDSQGRL